MLINLRYLFGTLFDSARDLQAALGINEDGDPASDLFLNKVKSLIHINGDPLFITLLGTIQNHYHQQKVLPPEISYQHTTPL